MVCGFPGSPQQFLRSLTIWSVIRSVRPWPAVWASMMRASAVRSIRPVFGSAWIANSAPIAGIPAGIPVVCGCGCGGVCGGVNFSCSLASSWSDIADEAMRAGLLQCVSGGRAEEAEAEEGVGGLSCAGNPKKA